MRTEARARQHGSTAAQRSGAQLQMRALVPEDRSIVNGILADTQMFRDDEIVIALEVLDSYFAKPGQDYTAVGAFTPVGELLGYVCYGPAPCTVGTFDLYWIAVSPAAQNLGVGTLLLQEVERRLAHQDARLVIIETSAQPVYEPTRAFYRRRGYDEVARVPDFYAPGDDRLIFAKRIQS